jgi:putative DNA methylase
MAATARKSQPWKDEGLTKPEWVAREVAKAVNAGKAWDLETVDFSDPNRPLTCLEVDFPIIPINQIAAIEGNAGKPIYQMSKWWARRRSSVFRSMLLAAAIKAPDDPAEAAKLVWDVYYGNHQTRGTFKHLKVADIFMGGGTTVVEGSRLGMQMYGNDLNPVAWFVVKNELAQVDKAEVEALLADIEAEVRPQIMPFYACDCPRGHKGKWTQVSTGKVMGTNFDPLALTPEERKDYRYDGPEVIYTFWAKHGQCPVTDCGHRTPIMSRHVVAEKTLSVSAWARTCKHCCKQYDIEERDARMAPGTELVVADTEQPYAVATLNVAGTPEEVTCPHCGELERLGQLNTPRKKAIELSLLVHPDWMKGERSKDDEGRLYGGSVDSPYEATARWNSVRAKSCKLVEVRGCLPPTIACADSEHHFQPDSGTKPKDGEFSCAHCGIASDYLHSVDTAGTNGPVAAFVEQCYCPHCDIAGQPYNGKYFASVDARKLNAAFADWARRSCADLAGRFPVADIPFGERTHVKDPLPKHGFTKWRHLFNNRQLLVHALLVEALDRLAAELPAPSILYGLGAVQQFLRYQNMLCFWHRARDHFAPALSNNNYNPKDVSVEVGTFCPIGYGPWRSVIGTLSDAAEWKLDPWELVASDHVTADRPDLIAAISTKSVKVFPGDTLDGRARVTCGSSTELREPDGSFDLVITDPPFGGLLQYSELADFLYVWLACSQVARRSGAFDQAETPKALECVSNTVRHDDPSGHYKRLLTACFRESGRVLKPGGLLAFTFHHSEDEPWVDVLESLFDTGYVLHATYPIRSDETKGDNAQFGSQKIEYDIIHVCRQRSEEPKPISWAKLRRQVLQDVKDIQTLLEHHQEDGLPEADLQVIRRGKALEYFSRHYGKVFKGPDAPMTVLEALLGINQLLDEEAGGIKEAPPHNAEPFTRMLLRLFDGVAELPRDQMQKFLRGTGSAPSDFESRGWVSEKRKVFHLVPPLELAQQWVGKQRRGMTSDYDQAMFFIGACFESSGINASETLNNPNFRPHPALGSLLTWFKTHGPDSPTRNAASMASQLYKAWEARNQPKAKELTLFDHLGEED